MGSTVCVRCGATLVPHSYCEVCQDVLCFICSSCSMNTVERIHAYCRNADIQNNTNNDIRKLVQIPNSSQIVLNDGYNYIQNQLNDKIKDSSIKLSTSYWYSIFESIKLVNRYWIGTFNIGNSRSSIA
jgi:hypothetical protein